MTKTAFTGVALLSAVLALGCSGSDADNTGGNGGDTNGGGGGSGGGGTGGGGKPTMLPTVPGVPDTSVDTALPPLPQMVNVKGNVRGDSVNITFDPIDGAVDYRVYELPNDADVMPGADNHLTINNATYRCAGNRQAPFATMDGAEQIQSGAVKTLVDGQNVFGYTRSLEEATLGYVSTVPKDGLVPVYALGSPDKDADNSCYFMRWGASRVKEYVTSTTERDRLLSERYRDDGIVFYVPADGTDVTRVVSTATGSDPNKPGFLLARYYFVDGPEAEMRGDATPAFSVFTEPADGLVPLQRVFYANLCGSNHDELVPGMARFDRARRQGDTVPMFDLHWSGISQETTLVVEALGDGCPKPTPAGVLGPVSEPGFVSEYNQPYPALVTIDEARSASDSGEVYINGQFDAGSRPRPIARTFLRVSPAPTPDFDWFLGFENETSVGALAEIPCENPVSCWQEWRWESSVMDVGFIAVETERHALAPVMGELWVAYGDQGADVNGKLRLTAATKGQVADDSYLYVTMEANAFTTGRRYPQILISDQEAPVHHNMPNGRTVVVQTFNDWPSTYEIQVCDHRSWEVNNQCPLADLYHDYAADDPSTVAGLAPNAEVGEHVGADRSTVFEVWLSSRRAYLYLDGEPYGCVDLPSTGAPPAGPVTVTFGDVLYHSDADEMRFASYMRENYQWVMTRHLDNLGFKSGAAAPPWDERRLPCKNTFK